MKGYVNDPWNNKKELPSANYPEGMRFAHEDEYANEDFSFEGHLNKLADYPPVV